MGKKRAIHRRGYWEYNKTELSTLTTHELPHEDKLDSLLKLVTNWYSPKEWEKLRIKKFDDYKFSGVKGIWKDSNLKTTAKEWLSIYRYSNDYADNWNSDSQNLDRLLTAYEESHEILRYKRKANVLDFGAGVGRPWENIPEEIDLFLVEVNLAAAEKLKTNYRQNSNVKIVTDLNDIKDIRFDFIYSKDTIEHVRYLNEHLNIFYILGKPTCRYTIFLDNCPSEGHVYDLHEDTVLNKFWLELYKFGRIKMFWYD